MIDAGRRATHCPIFGTMICIQATSFGGCSGSRLPEGGLKFYSASSRSLAGCSPHFDGQESMAAPKYASLPSQAQEERLTMLRGIVSFLCSKGTAGWSFASLSARLHIPAEKLRKEFGTEEALAEAAPEMLQHVVLAALTEPLRTARTGREAVHSLLETAISLRNGYHQCKNHRERRPSLTLERAPDALGIDECGNSLKCQIRDRFKRSVYEGELPEGANVLSMSALTVAVVSGLLFCAQEEASSATLLDSVRLFVDGLGFHVVRPPKRHSRRLAPILQFVRASIL